VLVTDENVVKMLRYQLRILAYDFDKCIAPNINLLTDIGAPKTRILQMLLRYPNVFCVNHPNFKGAVEAAIGMGFKPVNAKFNDALRILCVLSKATWDRKVMIYKSWGLSDDEVGIAFRSFPISMSLSEEKITKAMDIFVNEMGRNAADVARSSYVLGYNIENRIKPRCRVIKLLISKGFLKESISLGSFLLAGETLFVEKFVSKYEDKVPELLRIYQERQSI
jgi:mTERF domain-containing protein